MANPFEDLVPKKPSQTADFGAFSDLVSKKQDPTPAPQSTAASFEVPTPANLAADRARPVQPTQPKGFGERAQEVAGNVFPMARSFSREGAARVLGPSISALTTSGGALLGTPGGGVGIVSGAGLGYGIGEELTRRIRGDQPTQGSTIAKDIILGGALEAGGRGVITPLVEKGTSLAARIAGRLRDIPDVSRQRAANIAREAIGPENIGKAREALRGAIADDVTAAQALAQTTRGGRPVELPVLQALLKRAQERDPNFFSNVFARQEFDRLKELQKIAGGADQTSARVAREEMKDLLNQRLVPVLKTELEAANVAGRMAPQLQRDVAGFEGAAAGRVEDVRRMTAAAERARGTQEYPVPGMPRVSTRITYRGDLAEMADQFADDAAAGSLRLGEAARFKNAALESLEAHGLRPLTAQSVTAAINRKLTDPKVAPGNRDLQTAFGRVAEDIQQWTNSNGVIDAWALDNIRKNSINAYVNSLPLEPKQARELASNLTEQLRPLLIDAVEEAGGTGYRSYLRNYALGMQQIGQSRLGAEAMKVYATNPAGFVNLVEGNDPKKIEKVFGPGSYNIFKELSRDVQSRLTNIASQVKRDVEMKKQATAGEQALVDLLKGNMKFLRLPTLLNLWATTLNAAITALEGKVGGKTLQILTEAAKSAKSFDELLSVLPASERSVVLRTLQDPSLFEAGRLTVGGALAGMTTEARTPPVQIDRMGGISDMNPRFGAANATR